MSEGKREREQEREKQSRKERGRTHTGHFPHLNSYHIDLFPRQSLFFSIHRFRAGRKEREREREGEIGRERERQREKRGAVIERDGKKERQTE